jgi:hypothetical protein
VSHHALFDALSLDAAFSVGLDSDFVSAAGEGEPFVDLA